MTVPSSPHGFPVAYSVFAPRGEHGDMHLLHTVVMLRTGLGAICVWPDETTTSAAGINATADDYAAAVAIVRKCQVWMASGRKLKNA